ncbi:MAG: aspartate kinase [Oscillospiraceae bacterium]|nr:aspartate kinase [Oscillospiraceae bacterium]
MKPIVAKFGGSSLADAAQFRKVADIVRADADRRFVVASAPGKRNAADTKVTDLLYRCYELATQGQDAAPALALIRARFAQIMDELSIDFPLDEELGVIAAQLAAAPARDYMASRGEYLNAKLLAAYLGVPFVDAANTVRFSGDGRFIAEGTNEALATALRGVERAVIPGFYGADEAGRIHTFTRGGSDVTGALVARAVNARLYENWTDVSGMLFTDPRIVPNPDTIRHISYRELRELSYMGASVLHEDAVFPARAAGIPINIRNTNRPADAGTMISHDLPPAAAQRPVTGVAGRKGFSTLLVEQSLMNNEIGFGARLLNILAAHGVPFEHCPTGIDTISVVVDTAALDACREAVLRQIELQMHPDHLSVEDGLAMIAVVGHGMGGQRGIAARIFSAVAEAGVNIRMIDQGSSELNIIIGVDEADYEAAVRAICEKLRK